MIEGGQKDRKNGVMYFPKGIFQRATSQCTIFPSGNFSNVQFPKRQLPKGQVRPSETKPVAKRGGAGDAAMIDLGIFRLGNCTFGKIATWEKSFGKVPTIEEIKKWSEKVNEWEEKQK